MLLHVHGDPANRFSLFLAFAYRRALLRDCHPSNKDNDSGTRDAPLTKRGSKLSLQSSAGCSEQTVVENHLTELQQRLARAAGGARLRLVTVSAFSGKVIVWLTDCCELADSSTNQLNHLSTHASISQRTHPSVNAPIHESTHLSINPPTHSTISTPIHQPTYPSFNQPTHSSVHPPIHPSIHPFINPLTHPSSQQCNYQQAEYAECLLSVKVSA